MKKVVTFALFAFIRTASAGEVHGSSDFGIWFVTNDLATSPTVRLDDNYQEDHIERRYSLGVVGLRLTAEDILEGQQTTKLNFHLRDRSFVRLTQSKYSLGFEDRYRGELDEFNIEAQDVGEWGDVWFGRQTIYEAGGAMFDGVRAIYKMSDRFDLAGYGGLDADLRQLNGYIGPTYKQNPFSLKFQTAGVYASFRGEIFKTDAAIRSDFYKGKLDRGTLFSQMTYQHDSTWTFSGLVEYDIAGVAGLRNASLFVHTRPTLGVTNTLSLYRWSALEFKESDVSAIPVPAGIDSSRVGRSDVNTTSYNTVREQVMFRIFQRNYIFTGVQFAHRTFDKENQLKYFAGYRDPKFLGYPMDLRIQTDVIDNFRGFNVGLDTLLGKDFRDGEYRLEGGGAWYANEREVFLDYKPDPNQAPQREKEYALRMNGFWNPSKITSWMINYAFYRDIDATNAGQKVHTHEIYLSTNLRF